jgi:predicted ATPase/DNA-binding winged helix-turn-helix (wHTH) protein
MSEQPLRVIFPNSVMLLDPVTRSAVADGSPLPLTPKSFDILFILARAAGELVSTKDLTRQAWGRDVVNPAAIAKQFHALRGVLGPDAIITVPTRGYQLAAKVESVVTTAHSAYQLLPRPLPASASPLVGRDEEVNQLVALCRGEVEDHWSDSRKVLVVGPGGVGKTAVVLEAARAMAHDFPNAVAYVDLTQAHSASEVAAETGRALGLSFGGRAEFATLLAARVGQQTLLLILDTCEYVAAAVADLINIVHQTCPRVTIIAVSQRVLQIQASAIISLRPLPTEDACRLFNLRVAGGDSLRAPDSALTIEIVSNLDGRPLVIEMVAARARAYGLSVVRKGLSDLVRMLSSSGSSLPEGTATRHRGLKEILDWSYGLLDAKEQEAFRRLSIFCGLISVDGAIAVLAAFGQDLSEWDLLALLRRLADCSVLIPTGNPGEPVYRMLESIAEYGRGRLEQSDETNQAADAHARFFIARFETAEVAAEKMSDVAWLATYGPDLDNLRAARDWLSLSRERSTLAVKLFASAGPLWLRLGLAAEIRPAVDHLVTTVSQFVEAPDRALLLRTSGMLWRPSNRDRATALTGGAADLYRQLDQPHRLVSVLTSLGADLNATGQYQAAQGLLREAVSIIHTAYVPKTLIRLHNELGVCALQLGDLRDAERQFVTMRHIARGIDDLSRQGIALINLAEVQFRLDDVNDAIDLCQSAIDILVDKSSDSLRGAALLNSGSYNLLADRPEVARPKIIEAFSCLCTSGGYWLLSCVQAFALLCALKGDVRDAIQLAGFVDSQYDRSGERRQYLEVAIYQKLIELCHQSLSPAAVTSGHLKGERWQEDEACQVVRQRFML